VVTGRGAGDHAHGLRNGENQGREAAIDRALSISSPDTQSSWGVTLCTVPRPLHISGKVKGGAFTSACWERVLWWPTNNLNACQHLGLVFGSRWARDNSQVKKQISR